MKVAHFLKHFEPGGIEKWLVDFTKENHERGDTLELSYILQSKEVAFFDEEITSNGGELIKLNYSPKEIFSYLYNVYKVLKKGQFDVVHAHFYHFSGILLFVAFLAGVKVRVSHCHNDKSSVYVNSKLPKKAYLKFCQLLNDTFSNRKISVSESASSSLFRDTNNVSIIPCGLHFETFDVERSSKGNKIRLVNVGSYSEQKNHMFMLDIAKELKVRNIDFQLSFIGDGPLKEDINNRITEYELNSEVLLLGKRNDVQYILSHECDFFIFPSLFEGLGLAAVESQYYGATTIASNCLPKELNLSGYFHTLSISSESVCDWADSIVNLSKDNSANEVRECRDKISSSNMSIVNNFKAILDIYRK